MTGVIRTSERAARPGPEGPDVPVRNAELGPPCSPRHNETTAGSGGTSVITHRSTSTFDLEALEEELVRNASLFDDPKAYEAGVRDALTAVRRGLRRQAVAEHRPAERTVVLDWS